MAATTAKAKNWASIRASAVVSSGQYALFCGDSQEALRSIPNQSVDTCVTSPPYWRARDYGTSKQLGLEHEVDDYVARLVAIFQQVRRVLKDCGTAWLNIGDCYFNGCGTVNGRPPAKGWKRNKQLALVPFRVALALEEDGWWIRNVAVWHKPNAMPSSVKDRLTNTWEPVFLLAKSADYYFDLDAIRVPHQTDDSIERRRAENGHNNGKAKGKSELRRWLNSPRHRVTIDGLKEVRRRPGAPRSTTLAAYLQSALEKKGVTIGWVAEKLGLPFERTRHYFRTDAIGSRLPPEETWHRLKGLLDLGPEYDDAMTVELGDNVFRNHPKGKNPGDMTSIASSGASQEHFATMPVPLAEWALKATLPTNGVCLDPFMGTGATGIAAMKMGGRFVGIDVQKSFLSQFVGRLHVGKLNGKARANGR
jgi:DNA modification methylase